MAEKKSSKITSKSKAKPAKKAGAATKSSKSVKATSKLAEPETMAELLKKEDCNIPTFKKDSYIEGKLVSILPKEVFVDIGGKANAVVGFKELENLADIFADFGVGDKVIGRVLSEENRDGRVVISLTKFAYDHRWGKLQKAYKKSEKVKVLVRDIVNGGILIDYNTIRGYIPPSHVDPDYKNEPQKLRGRTIEVKILEINREQNRLVVSQKLVTRKEQMKQIEKALKKIKVGDVIDAEVEGIVPFGLFVRIDSGIEPIDKGARAKKDREPIVIEGLVHISEIAWEKVDEASEYFTIGDKVKVKVLDKDEKEGKLNLSIKQTTKDPWVEIKKKYNKGDMVKGKVTRQTAYGVFVELERGIEGLAHISNIPAGSEPKEGEKVTAQIDNIDLDERRIALSIIPKGKPVMYR